MFTFLKKKEKKPAVVAIHGFGKRRTDQLIPLRDFLHYHGYEVYCPVLFNQKDELDTNPDEWLRRASIQVEQLLNEGKEVILVGFSMGGVIASSLAASYNIKKLILLAPAFSYVNLNNVSGLVQSFFDSDDEEVSFDGYLPLPHHFTQTFRTLVDNHRDKISQVPCPVLIFHGNEDKTISVNSSKQVIKKISHQHRALIILNEGGHHLLEDELNHKIVLETSLNFIENKL